MTCSRPTGTRHDRTQGPHQSFHAGVRKPRELTHDTSVYRAYQRADALDVARRATAGNGNGNAEPANEAEIQTC